MKMIGTYMTHKHIISIIVALAASSFALQAQTEAVDTAGVAREAVVDSTLVGKNIISLLDGATGGKDGDVTLHQSANIKKAYSSQLASNGSRKINGYRVRIFSDNKQNARGASEAAMNRFKGMYPSIPAYRTYTNPFFKVTVGDFRTKSEAMKLLRSIKGSFPTAFIVAETIDYPVSLPETVSEEDTQ